MTDISVQRVPRKSPSMLLAEVRLGRSLDGFLRERYVQQGATQRQVADELGIDVSTVTRWMHEFGIPSHPRGRRAA